MSTHAFSQQKWLPYLALAVAVLIAYCNVYDNALLFDDTIIILSNDYLKDWSHFGQLFTTSTTAGSHATGGFYRPLQMILYFFLYRIDGPDPFLFHLLNVVLHAANACLVFTLGRRLGFNLWATFFAALIWAMHPLHTEAITYASGTAEPLLVFFCLLGLIALFPDFAPKRFFIALPFFIFALLSKEGAVVFPALAMSCLFLQSPYRLHPRTYFRTWPLWLVALGFTAWRMTVPGFDGPQSYDAFYVDHGFDNLTLYADHFWYRFFTFLATLPAYAELLVWPTGLHMERNFQIFVSMRPVETWFGLAIVVGAMAQIMWISLHIMSQAPSLPRRRESYSFLNKWDARLCGHDATSNSGLPLSWGLLWFAAAYFPNTGLLVPMNSQFLEHWMYVPTIGLFLGIAETLFLTLDKWHWEKAKRVIALAAFALATIFAFLTFEQNAVWYDPFTFYGNIFKHGEVSPRAHNNLALAYMDKGDYPAAIAEFYKAIALTDTYPETRHNLALALLQLPNPDTEIPDAIESLNRAIEIDPHFYRSWDVLATIYDHLGNKEKAAECRAKAKGSRSLMP